MARSHRPVIMRCLISRYLSHLFDGEITYITTEVLPPVLGQPGVPVPIFNSMAKFVI
nr:hypothetical protein Q903MT_gene524 [Picea sitchensis]